MIRAQGIDFAVKNQVHYDYRAFPHDFIVLKVSSGNLIDATRKEYPEQLNFFDALPEIAPVPVRIGYHYVSPTDWVPWREQVVTYVNAIRQAPANFFHKHAIDIERMGMRDMTAQWGRDSEFIVREVEQQLGVQTIPYTNPSTYMQLWQLGVRWMIYKKIWIAQYPFRRFDERILEAVENVRDWLPYLPPYHEGDWLIWQCSADENRVVKWGAKHGVLSDAVDWDLFNGSWQALAAWAGLTVDEFEAHRQQYQLGEANPPNFSRPTRLRGPDKMDRRDL